MNLRREISIGKEQVGWVAAEWEPTEKHTYVFNLFCECYKQ